MCNILSPTIDIVLITIYHSHKFTLLSLYTNLFSFFFFMRFVIYKSHHNQICHQKTFLSWWTKTNQSLSKSDQTAYNIVSKTIWMARIICENNPTWPSDVCIIIIYTIHTNKGNNMSCVLHNIQIFPSTDNEWTASTAGVK